MLGDRRHSYEQRMGQRFLDLGIYPTKKYFSEKPHEETEV